VRIDLHTHSDRSDGTQSPADLVRAARDQGLDVVGVTDHDTTEGWAEAEEAARCHGIGLVRGIEVSCRFAGYGVHLIAYLPDPTYPPLAEELRRILDGRRARLPATLSKLRDLGIDIDVEDVRRVSGETAAMGRPHVADALASLGVVVDRGEAFEVFLGPQGPAYVPRYAADLETMLGLVAGAGGISVLAHPWASRHNHTALDEAGIARLARAGLAGLEVDHEDHSATDRAGLRAIALRLGLLVTGSSDHHGAGKSGHDLGCNTTAPDQLDRLVAAAEQAAAAAGRAAPGLLRP